MTAREMTGIGDFFACALTKALGNRAEVYNYDDPKGFARLWELDAVSTDCETNDTDQDCSGGRHVVLVWDGRSGSVETGAETPAQESETESGQSARAENAGASELIAAHLTPLDWALAFSVKALRCEQIPKFAIRIVDLTAKDHDEWAFRWRDALLARMPWVTLHAPLIPSASAKPVAYRAGYRPILGEKGEDPLLHCDGGSWELTACPTLVSSGNSRAVESLRELLESWVATAARTRDHHDLNNIVGPWILAELESNDRWIGAFRQKMKWSGLYADSAGRGSSESTSETGHEETVDVQPVISGEVRYNVLAIDDMMSRGWDKIILKIFGAKGKTEVINYSQIQQFCDGSRTPHIFGSAAADVGILLEALGWTDGNEADCAKYRRRCFDSPIPDNGRTPWILALDLMLFSDRRSAERDCIGKLLTIAEEISDIPKRSLAWPGFSQKELKEVRKWLEAAGSPDDPRYETALSLLPRLCALRWPAVPILLFSATGRRALIGGLVEKYGNVFDAPAKPNLLYGDAEENAAAFWDGWRRATEEGLAYIKVQKKLLDLISSSAEPEGRREDPGSTGPDTRHRHLTIAFDESGNFETDAFSAIGGVIVEATGVNENDTKKSTFRFLEALRANGVNFYDHPPVYTEVLTNGKEFYTGRLTHNRNNFYHLKNKNDYICDEIGQTLICHESVQIAVFRCLVNKRLYEGASNSDGVSNPDGVYLKWLARTLELVLCEFLPSCGYQRQNTTLSIWFPTRSIKGEPKLARQFDLFVQSESRFQTVGGYSVALEIVHRALEGRPNVEEVLKKCHLKTRKIPYFYTCDDDQPRYESALHWCCKKCKAITPPLASRPRLQPVEANNPTMMPVRFSTSRQNYHVYNAQGERLAEGSGRHVTCGSCDAQYIPADYSVAQHLADACLTKTPNVFPSDKVEFGSEDAERRPNICRSISFDVNAGEVLEDLIAAGRLFDVGRGHEAFMTSFCRDWFRDVLKGRNGLTAPIGRRIQQKSREYALSIGGREIEKLASK